MREGTGRISLWRPELGSVAVSVLTALYLLALTHWSFWSVRSARPERTR